MFYGVYRAIKGLLAGKETDINVRYKIKELYILVIEYGNGRSGGLLVIYFLENCFRSFICC